MDGDKLLVRAIQHVNIIQDGLQNDERLRVELAVKTLKNILLRLESKSLEAFYSFLSEAEAAVDQRWRKAEVLADRKIKAKIQEFVEKRGLKTTTIRDDIKNKIFKRRKKTKNEKLKNQRLGQQKRRAEKKYNKEKLKKQEEKEKGKTKNRIQL